RRPAGAPSRRAHPRPRLPRQAATDHHATGARQRHRRRASRRRLRLPRRRARRGGRRPRSRPRRRRGGGRRTRRVGCGRLADVRSPGGEDPPTASPAHRLAGRRGSPGSVMTSLRSAHARAVPLRVRPRSALALTLACLVGVAGYGWPFLADSTSSIGGHSTDAPYLFALLLPLVVAIVVAELSDGGMDAKAVAMLGVLAAVGAGLRAVSPGTGGFE